MALSILVAIKEQGNQIANNPLFSSGLVSPVDIGKIASDLHVPFDLVRSFAVRFRDANWLIFSAEGDIFGVSDYCIKVLRKKRLI